MISNPLLSLTAYDASINKINYSCFAIGLVTLLLFSAVLNFENVHIHIREQFIWTYYSSTATEYMDLYKDGNASNRKILM